MTTAFVILGILVCLCLSAFCSSSEMSYSSCNVVRLENMRDDGSKRAAVAVKITEKFDDALSAILIGNNLANIAASSLASVLVILLLGNDRYAWAATAVLTLLVIIFGETIPKITAKKAANTLALRYAYAQASPGLYARLLEAACAGYEARPLKCAPLLFGKALHTTVSRLEAYAGCAYQHFLRYGLKLAERPAAGVMAFDTGNVLHEAIRLFGEKAAQEGTTLAGFSDELLERWAPEAVKDAAAMYGEQLFGADARSFYLLRQYAGILKSSLRAIRYQLKEGSFLPRAFELPVDGEKRGILLPSGGRLFFHGRIDRADIAEGAEEAWLKILDYKTGEKTFKPEAVLRGTQLQLPLYMAAALRRLQKDTALPLAPGGMLYQQLKDPVLEEGKEAEREKEYRPSGLISAKPEILRAFDRGLGAGGNSAVIPVGINKDGSFRASSGAVNPEEFDAVLSAAEKKAAALADRILQGDIALSPLEEEGKLHCAYCPYRHVCGFDLKLQGCAIRREEMTPEEALLRMRPPAEKAGEDRGKK